MGEFITEPFTFCIILQYLMLMIPVHIWASLAGPKIVGHVGFVKWVLKKLEKETVGKQLNGEPISDSNSVSASTPVSDNSNFFHIITLENNPKIPLYSHVLKIFNKFSL